MVEQFANNADSTLNGAINNVTTTVVVADGSPFPSVGDFRLLIGSNPDTGELVLVTARSGNTLTVVRGQEGTSAQSWTDGTVVTHILTAGAIYTLQQTLRGKSLNASLETVGSPQDGYALTWLNSDGYWAARPGGTWYAVGKDGYGTFASRPAAGNPGARYISSDGMTEFVDIGSEWKPLIQGRLGKQIPLVSSFSSITANSKSASYTDQAGTIKISWNHTSAGEDLHILKKAAPTPGATGYRVTVHFRPILPINNASGSFVFGVGFRQSSNGNIEGHQWVFSPNSPNRSPIRHRYTASNTTSNPVYSFNSQVVGNVGEHFSNIWIRIERDTSTGNRRCYMSQDGLNFREITAFGSSSNEFITPDEVFITAWNSNDAVGGEQGMIFDSYEEEAY